LHIDFGFTAATGSMMVRMRTHSVLPKIEQEEGAEAPGVQAKRI